MDLTSSGLRLRARLREPTVCRVFGVHDGLGARLAEREGVDALWASGLGISASAAVPDASILTMTDFLAAVRSIRSGSDLPVIADCDSGFGDVNNVARMVEEYERAGVAAVCLEDKEFPKRNSFTPGQRLAAADEFAAKITIATETRRDPSFMVWARLESLITGAGMSEAIERALLYEAAGADALLVHSKARDGSEVLEFVKRYRDTGSEIPLAVVPTTYPTMSAVEFEQAGGDVVIYANQALRASIAATKRVLRQVMADGSTSRIEDDIETVSSVLSLIGTDELTRREERAAGLVAHYRQMIRT